MSKHTPGPWLLLDGLNTHGKESELYSNATSEINEPICIVPHDDMTEEGPEEVRADIRLIAAAPDLLSAVRAILFQVNQGKVLERDSCISRARSAYIKATGSEA